MRHVKFAVISLAVVCLKMCNAAEHRSVDTLIDRGPQKAGLLDVKVVQGEFE